MDSHFSARKPRGKDEDAQHAAGRRLGGRGDAQDDEPDDHEDHEAHRQDVESYELDLVEPCRGRHVIGRRPRRVDDDLKVQHAGIQQGQHEARQEARDQQTAHVDVGDAGEKHGQRRGRDDHGQAAGAQDGPHGHSPVVAPPLHLRHQQRSQHGGTGHGGAGEGGEDRAAGHRQVAEPAPELAEQAVEPVENANRQTGVKEQRPHEDEHGHGTQGEPGDQHRGVVHHLDEPVGTGKDEDADEVRGDEGEGHRDPHGHQTDDHAHQKSECPVPFHHTFSRTSVREVYMVSTPTRNRMNSKAIMANDTGMGNRRSQSGWSSPRMSISPETNASMARSVE